MTVDFLYDGPEAAEATILLAHGAGAAMDSKGMESLTEAIAGAGLRVVRFEFGYMAARRTGTRHCSQRAARQFITDGCLCFALPWTWHGV